MESKKIFESVKRSQPPYSSFDLSHEKKLSFDMGELIPCLIQEVVPGDQFKGSTETMIRFAPMIAPVMHRINVFVHYFFVPNRIIWNQWEDFITGGKDGETNPPIPTISLTPGLRAAGTLPDYLGIPVNPPVFPLVVQDLPFRAYNQIFNDYYRDPNLTDEASLTNLNIHYRAWEKDYFTSALPFAQRGPEVTIPITAEADWAYKEPKLSYAGNLNQEMSVVVNDATANLITGSATGIPANVTELDNIDSITVENISTTINDLRRSSALQRWLERQATGGYRYIETIHSQFGVQSSDKRLQRAEYLGGGKQAVVISEVLNTSNTPEAPQGNMSGHGVSTGQSNTFKYTAEEHGYIMGIISILPRTAYQQGLPRHYMRRDRFDYYWPEFANLGEQEVFEQEVYAANSAQTTWGYQQRYAEYKYAFDTVHGDFKSTLNFWHCGRIFESLPNLNEQFVTAQDVTKRIFAVEEGDHIWCQLYNDIKARRPMPYFADPRLT